MAINNLEYIIFPEYKKRVDEKVLETFLSFSESIIRLTESRPLPHDSIGKLISILGKSFKGKLYAGGKDALFAWSFECQGMNLILKPYYSQMLAPLVLHYLTIDEFGETIKLSIRKKKVTVQVPPVIGIGKILTPTLEKDAVPVLITLESEGKEVTNVTNKKTMVPKICSALKRRGYMIDTKENNWRFLPKKAGNTFEYIELINSKKITNLKEKISKLIKEITESGKRF